ncbi:hypothetical protein F8568_043840 [Actinomadura sp. LD22]|uniref:Lipoprotein n=1 Tax=Actinomadura physcomitrii TaxID=2650748 RepID=A0A6I4MXP3_9ACTN|nr:hypothetical protein [Actinomadura physcomitrii]MWA07156.1 hypothetical protein [Actinomadura physcomitrii]
MRAAMARRAIAGLVLAALAAAPLAGCSGDDEGKEGTTAAAAPTATGAAASTKAEPRRTATKAAVAWAGRVCRAIPPGITDSPLPKINARDVAASERAIAAYMTGMAKRLDTVRARLQQAGSPPMADGRAVLDATLKDLEATGRQLRDAASGLRTGRPGTPAFRTAQADAGKAMRRLGGYRPPTRALRASPAIGDAFTRAAPCKKPGV